MDATKKEQNFVGENAESQLLLLTDTVYPRLEVTFGGADAVRPKEEIDAESFIGQKSFKAKGKRLSTWEVASVQELEPLRFPENNEEDEPDGAETAADENLDPDAGKSQQQVIDEMTGQLNLFTNDTNEET